METDGNGWKRMDFTWVEFRSAGFTQIEFRPGWSSPTLDFAWGGISPELGFVGATLFQPWWVLPRMQPAGKGVEGRGEEEGEDEEGEEDEEEVDDEEDNEGVERRGEDKENGP